MKPSLEENNIMLSKKEWICTVKQLGMMPVLYNVIKLVTVIRRRYHIPPSPKQTIYEEVFNATPTEKTIFKQLDYWEKRLKEKW